MTRDDGYHRVVRTIDPDFEFVTYEVCIVHCDEDGILRDILKVGCNGDTPGRLREEIRRYLHAFHFPILEEKETEKGKILVPRNSVNIINDRHYIDLLDRTSVAADYIHQFVGCHPLVVRNRVLRDKCLLVIKALNVFFGIASRFQSKSRIESGNGRTENSDSDQGELF